MHLLVPLTLLASSFQAAQLPSPVLPIELISRNAAGQQPVTGGISSPLGINANGSKVAFSVYDPTFLGETPAPLGTGAFSRYGQIAIWQRGTALSPLIRLPDGLGPNDGFPPKSADVFFDKFENRICFVSYAGDLVSGQRNSASSVSIFCEAPDGRYEYAGYSLQTGLPGFAISLGGSTDFDVYQNGRMIARNRRTGSMEYLNVDDQGQLGQLTVTLPNPGVTSWPRMSQDSRYAVFVSDQNTLVPGDNSLNEDGSDVFIRHRLLRTTRRITRNDGSEFLGVVSGADIAGNGSIVVFTATGDVVEPCSTGIPSERGGRALYSYHIATQTLECLSVNDDNQAMGIAFAIGADVSADGRFVLFGSFAPLYPEDTNNRVDLFIRDRLKHRTYWVSQAANGMAGNNAGNTGRLSSDGNWLAFGSFASNLVPGDQNGNNVDVFLRDLRPLKSEPLSLPSNDWRWIALLIGLALAGGLNRLRHS